MNYRIKTTSKEKFDTALIDALDLIGDYVPLETLNESGNVNFNIDITTVFEEESIINKKLINIDWYRCYPIKVDVNGTKINVGSLEEPVYEKYDGYHIELVSNISLNINSELLVTPNFPQFKWL